MCRTMIRNGAVLVAAWLCTVGSPVRAFSLVHRYSHPRLPRCNPSRIQSSSTALQVWWFGGAESEASQDDESCELVAVRIDRTSPNSRRISGSISVPTTVADVWSILTDYDRLAIHVPNLVESKIVSRPSKGEQGDGSYRCKLFQKGAQKIVGFEFGASVTMEMKEEIRRAAVAPSDFIEAGGFRSQEKAILFKCVDSFFFSEFDGEWKAKEMVSETGEVETELTYVVDVRPKGPVPVAALEWRIREDVPTNLRAVKKASMEVGAEGVLASRKRTSMSGAQRLASKNAASTKSRPASRRPELTQLSTNTNAIRRATLRRPTGFGPVPTVRPSSPRQGKTTVAAPTLSNVKKPVRANVAKARRNNILQAGRRSQTSAATKSCEKRGPLPFKVTWEADETMAAYLRE